VTRSFDAEFVACANRDADARRLAPIPGIGAFNATAVTAAIGKGQTFAPGRDRSAGLGLVPRQATTGGKPMLRGIGQRGHKYRRQLLIHGARAAVPHLAARGTALGRWAKGLRARVHPHVAAAALANKRARIAWAVVQHGEQLTAAGLPSAAAALADLRLAAQIGPGWLRGVKRRSPDSQMGFWNPGLKNGARRRAFDAGRNARISLLARGRAARPETLKQTDYSRRSRSNHLPTGRAIRC